jgi:hypothetical protein
VANSAVGVGNSAVSVGNRLGAWLRIR